MGAEFRLGAEAAIESLEREFNAIFLGVGLGSTHRLNIPGETLPEVVDALQFIAAYKTSSIHVGRRVIIIGAGNTAIDAATAAHRLGAEEVHIIYRRGQDEMPAFDYEYELALLDNVEFHWHIQPDRTRGTSIVESAECVRWQHSL